MVGKLIRFRENRRKILYQILPNEVVVLYHQNTGYRRRQSGSMPLQHFKEQENITTTEVERNIHGKETIPETDNVLVEEINLLTLSKEKEITAELPDGPMMVQILPLR